MSIGIYFFTVYLCLNTSMRFKYLDDQRVLYMITIQLKYSIYFNKKKKLKINYFIIKNILAIRSIVCR